MRPILLSVLSETNSENEVSETGEPALVTGTPGQGPLNVGFFGGYDIRSLLFRFDSRG